jgi:hypothetical protein
VWPTGKEAAAAVAVIVDVVAHGVSEVEEGLYGMLGSSVRWYARSMTPGVVSYGG